MMEIMGFFHSFGRVVLLSARTERFAIYFAMSLLRPAYAQVAARNPSSIAISLVRLTMPPQSAHIRSFNSETAIAPACIQHQLTAQMVQCQVPAARQGIGGVWVVEVPEQRSVTSNPLPSENVDVMYRIYALFTWYAKRVTRFSDLYLLTVAKSV